MVLQPNYKRLGAENIAPAQLNAKTLIATSERRRRVRSTVAPYSKHNVAQSKRRRTKGSKSTVRVNVTTLAAPSPADVEMKNGESSKNTLRTVPMSFPRELARPDFKEISKDAIQSIDPELADCDVKFLRDHLEDMGADLLISLAAVKASPAKDKLSKELTITVNDSAAFLPTHMLAVFGKQIPNATTPRKVTVYPVHSLVLATQCANLPPFPAALPAPVVDKAPYEASLPVWSLCLPAPLTYPQLSTYLYTKRVDVLMRSFLPMTPPPALLHDPSQLTPFARHLADTFTVHALIKHVLSIHGLWQNMCALGIFDETLWNALDTMWETLLTAIAIGTGNPTAMRSSPEPTSPTEESVTQPTDS